MDTAVQRSDHFRFWSNPVKRIRKLSELVCWFPYFVLTDYYLRPRITYLCAPVRFEICIILCIAERVPEWNSHFNCVIAWLLFLRPLPSPMPLNTVFIELQVCSWTVVCRYRCEHLCGHKEKKKETSATTWNGYTMSLKWKMLFSLRSTFGINIMESNTLKQPPQSSYPVDYISWTFPSKHSTNSAHFWIYNWIAWLIGRTHNDHSWQTQKRISYAPISGRKQWVSGRETQFLRISHYGKSYRKFYCDEKPSQKQLFAEQSRQHSGIKLRSSRIRNSQRKRNTSVHNTGKVFIFLPT